MVKHGRSPATPIIQGNGPQGIYSIDFYNENNGIIIGGDYSEPLENKANKAVYCRWR